mmetsp:Transcript_19262/g.61176  ORF Transcript_19262/g.61176 Transcript_19262/m.61176 type:complete len:252 (-) Transcript_19262:841-1596(-)
MRFGGSANGRPCCFLTSGMIACLPSKPQVQIFACPAASRSASTSSRSAWSRSATSSCLLQRAAPVTRRFSTPTALSSGRASGSSEPSIASGQRVSSHSPTRSSYCQTDGDLVGSGAREERDTSIPVLSALNCRSLPSAASVSVVNTVPMLCNGAKAPAFVRPTNGGEASTQYLQFMSTTAAPNSTSPSKGRPSFNTSPIGSSNFASAFASPKHAVPVCPALARNRPCVVNGKISRWTVRMPSPLTCRLATA